MDAPEDRSKALNEYMSSGFAPRADIVAACRHVRFVPGAVVSRCSNARAREAELFNHLIGDAEQRRRYGEAEHPGRLGVDD
jgi:hypothetical protein